MKERLHSLKFEQSSCARFLPIFAQAQPNAKIWRAPLATRQKKLINVSRSAEPLHMEIKTTIRKSTPSSDSAAILAPRAQWKKN